MIEEVHHAWFDNNFRLNGLDLKYKFNILLYQGKEITPKKVIIIVYTADLFL